MRGESSESIRRNVSGSVIRAQPKTKPVTMPSASAARRSLISDHRLEQERRADRSRHDRHRRDDARGRGERRSGQPVAGGAAPGGPGPDSDQESGAEEERDLAAEGEVA